MLLRRKNTYRKNWQPQTKGTNFKHSFAEPGETDLGKQDEREEEVVVRRAFQPWSGTAAGRDPSQVQENESKAGALSKKPSGAPGYHPIHYLKLVADLATIKFQSESQTFMEWLEWILIRYLARDCLDSPRQQSAFELTRRPSLTRADLLLFAETTRL